MATLILAGIGKIHLLNKRIKDLASDKALQGEEIQLDTSEGAYSMIFEPDGKQAQRLGKISKISRTSNNLLRPSTPPNNNAEILLRIPQNAPSESPHELLQAANGNP